MPLRRKTRNLPKTNDKDKTNHMKFFEPVYQNENIQMSDSESSVNDLSRQTFGEKIEDESNETLDAVPIKNSINDQEQSSQISMSKISLRINQIQNSIEQAQTMLESMENFKHLVPGSNEQCEKLRVIIANLEEQQNGYVNLLNLIKLTNAERSKLIEKISSEREMSTNVNDEDDNNDDEEEEEEEEEENNDRSPRRNARSPVRRPRIESKIGFTPHPITPLTPTVPPFINSPDNEQNNRNDNSNYDSLVGSLKSDTINWKDQQSTSGDDASDADSDKEMEKNLMLQKEQLRALQGQKRALLALKKRSEQRLLEQQQLITKKQSADTKTNLSENDLLSDINNLRDRLKLLRNLYEQKHQVEVQQIKNSSKKSPMSNENRSKTLQHVREQLDQLEHIVREYQLDLINPPEEETTIYEETPIDPDDVQRLKALIMQQRQSKSSTITNIENNDENQTKPLDKLSTELAAKRLELEQAKSALNRLQQMVKRIEPDENCSSTGSTPIPSTNTNQYVSTSTQQKQSTMLNPTPSLLSSILSPKPTEQKQNLITNNGYADAKMAAQQREIERLIESRQRLHTIKDQIASLHQSMATSPLRSQKESTNERKNSSTEGKKQIKNYEDISNNSRNARLTYTLNDPEDEDDDEDSELYRFECESGDGEEIDDESDEDVQPRIKQGNFHAPEDIVAEHEQRLLNKKSNSTENLSTQMREICQCLTSFIQEQKSFNRHIEQHLSSTTNNSQSTTTTNTQTNSVDPIFNQLQQQVLTQGLIVNLNTAYREIAILQSEINALQLENNRLTSSVSSYNSQYRYQPRTYSREDSKESIYSLDQIKPIRPQPRSRFNEHIQQQNHILTTNNKFENSSKTSFNSQSTGKQTAIHLDKNTIETTPIKHERNATFTSDHLPSRPKKPSDEYEISSKENSSNTFIIRRRQIPKDNEDTFIKSQLFNYGQQLKQNTFNDDSEDESQQKINNSSTIHDLNHIDVQILDGQIKSIISQLIPFMRLHINDICDQSILTHVRERLLYLFRQQPEISGLIQNFQDQFCKTLDKTIEKYCGTAICDSAVNLIRDISDVTFDELIKYKIFSNATNNQTTNVDEQITRTLNKQQDNYSNLYDSTARHYTEQTSSVDDGENDNKYQIELAESESRPLMLIGSDEEDNDSDQEENKDSELETAVSRQESNINQNEIIGVATTSSSTELHSNGHEYILINPSINNNNNNNNDVQEETKEQEKIEEEKENLNNENEEITNS